MLRQRNGVIKLGENADPLPTSSPESNTIFYHELPEWQKDNDAITSGYRRELFSFRKCFKSIYAYSHNETVNIWSHLAGAGVALSSLFYSFSPFHPHYTTIISPPLGWMAPFTLLCPIPNSNRPSVTIFDSLAFGTFFTAAITCLGCSALFHTVTAHSMEISRAYNKLDYVGIVALISGTFVPVVFYGFHSDPMLRNLYLSMITIASLATAFVVLSPRGKKSESRKFRTYCFIGLGTSGIVPILHGMLKYGIQNASEALSLPWLALGGIFYIAGALLYAERCPERLFTRVPGRFDLIGSSHQIFHIFIIFAAWFHYTAIAESARYLHSI